MTRTGWQKIEPRTEYRTEEHEVTIGDHTLMVYRLDGDDEALWYAIVESPLCIKDQPFFLRATRLRSFEAAKKWAHRLHELIQQVSVESAPEEPEQAKEPEPLPDPPKPRPRTRRRRRR